MRKFGAGRSPSCGQRFHSSQSGMTTRESEGGAHRFLPLLIVLFIGSGCAALIYEIVWFQMLSLIVGSSALSLGVILGTFMGGMCLGSLFFSKYISRAEHPLRVYALLEGAIAIFGLLVLWLLPWAGGLYFKIAVH